MSVTRGPSQLCARSSPKSQIDGATFPEDAAGVIAIPKCLKKHAEDLRKIRLSQRRITSAEARRQCERVEKSPVRSGRP